MESPTSKDPKQQKKVAFKDGLTEEERKLAEDIEKCRENILRTVEIGFDEDKDDDEEEEDEVSESPRQTKIRLNIPEKILEEGTEDKDVDFHVESMLSPAHGVPTDQAVAERGTWTGKFDFILSLLGYSVGLGNVWRFPYLAYSNGGGAFLLPFAIMLFLVGFPLMFMELSFGQFASLGPIAVYEKFCPLFQGLGYGMVIVSSIVAIYYNMIIAWTFYYIFLSCTSELPWERCREPWATSQCYSTKDADECHQVNGTVFYNNTCFNVTDFGDTNITALLLNTTKKSPSEEYFE